MEFPKHFLEKPAYSQGSVNIALRCLIIAQGREGIPNNSATTGGAGTCTSGLGIVVRTASGSGPRVGPLPLRLEDQVDEPNHK